MLHETWDEAAVTARAVLAAHGGVAKMHMFLAAGLTNRQVAALVHHGVLARPRYGWYVDPDLSWQAEHAVRVGGVLACVSAAGASGLPVPPGSHLRLHVLVPLNSARIRSNRDKQHYVVPGEDREVELHWSTAGRSYAGWRTPLVDTLLQLQGCVSEDWWIAALDAARHAPRGGAPLLSDADWQRLAERVPRRLRSALERVDTRSESPIETLIRLGSIRRGIGPVTPQFSPDGRRFVDLLVGERLIVEADGDAFHDPEKDALRDAGFRRLGYTVLRFSYRRIVDDLDAVLDEIAAALAATAGAL